MATKKINKSSSLLSTGITILLAAAVIVWLRFFGTQYRVGVGALDRMMVRSGLLFGAGLIVILAFIGGAIWLARQAVKKRRRTRPRSTNWQTSVDTSVMSADSYLATRTQAPDTVGTTTDAFGDKLDDDEPAFDDDFDETPEERAKDERRSKRGYVIATLLSLVAILVVFGCGIGLMCIGAHDFRAAYLDKADGPVTARMTVMDAHKVRHQARYSHSTDYVIDLETADGDVVTFTLVAHDFNYAKWLAGVHNEKVSYYPRTMYLADVPSLDN